MGHEYCGVVEEVGRGVTSIKPGQFVIGSFFASDNTCPHCRHGYQTSCQRFEAVVGAQAPHMRVPLADGTLVATRDVPDTDMIPSLLALSDVMGTGWFAADAADVKPGGTVVVVGDLFYRSFRTTYSYTNVGRVDDPAGLEAAVGSGNVDVIFELARERKQ
jgi:threonine dehydrogenase-like Zn-dependent dehydrogenase